MTLFSNPITHTNDRSIDERFAQFHEKHPEVFVLFRQFAVQRLSEGFTHYSADALLHRVRWETDANAEREGGFKINDHYSSRYARLLSEQDPRFADFFEFRKLRSA